MVRPSYMKIMLIALLNSKTGISKVTEPNIFYPSSSLLMSCRKLERSTSFRSGLVRTQPTSSPSHCPPAHSGSSRSKLACEDPRTFSDVQIRGIMCVVLFFLSLVSLLPHWVLGFSGRSFNEATLACYKSYMVMASKGECYES